MVGVLSQNLIRCSFQLRLPSSSSSSSYHGFVSFAVSSSSSPQYPSALFSTATSLFQSYGFSDDNIDRILDKLPRIVAWPHERIQNKLDSFVSFGFSPSELITLVSIDPEVITLCSKNRLLHNLNLLENILGSKKLVKKAIGLSSRLLRLNLEKTLLPNVNILESHGVPSKNIAQAVVHYPAAMVNKSEAISDVVNELKGLGVDPAARAFIVAINAKLVINKEQWSRKVALYQSFCHSHIQNRE